MSDFLGENLSLGDPPPPQKNHYNSLTQRIFVQKMPWKKLPDLEDFFSLKSPYLDNRFKHMAIYILDSSNFG
jgi:hypothetical protein